MRWYNNILTMPIRKKQSKRSEYKLVLLGDSAAGKTTFFQSFLGRPGSHAQSISAVDFSRKRISLHDKEVTLSLWDTASQQQFRTITSGYLKSASGVLILFDLTNTVSWANAKAVWYQLARAFAPNAPCILVGNKSDLPAAVAREEIAAWSRAEQIYFIQTFATSGLHVKETVMTLAAMADVQRDRSWDHDKRIESPPEEQEDCKETSITTAETSHSVRAKYNPEKSNLTSLRDSTNIPS